MPSTAKRRWLAVLMLGLSADVAIAAQVNVALAANFSAPMQRIAAEFEQATGHRVVLSSGSTGKLYAQIRNGAPYQLLLAADEATPARLVREGFGDAGSRMTYAIGRLALWSPLDGLVDAQGEVLRRAGFERLAIANPRLAPYGAAALEVLRALGLEQRLASRIVQGENIGQTWQFVATGNAALGFVALSQIMRDGTIERGSAWIVPQRLHAPIRQDAVLLAAGAGSTAAKALLRFLQEEKARAIIASFGYGLAR